MILAQGTAIGYAKELTISAIENHLIQSNPDDTPEEVAEKVVKFYNTIADSLSGN